MLVRVLIAIFSFAVITIIFKWASGTLSPMKLNIISVTYYIYIIMMFIGTSLMYIGLVGNHYIVRRLSQDTIDLTFLVVVLTGIGLAFVVVVVNVLLGNLEPKATAIQFNSAPMLKNYGERQLYTVAWMLAVLAILSTVYTFYQLGGIPLIDSIRGDRLSSLSARIRAKYGFGGIAYIRSLGMLTLAPMLSIFTFVCYRVIGTRRWRTLFFLCLILAAVALTYDLEKAPIVYHLFFLFVTACMLGRDFDRRGVVKLAFAAAALLAVGYIVTGSADALVFDLEHGIFARTTIAYPSAMGLHLALFPGYSDYLHGGALPGFITSLFGLGDDGARSARIVMAAINQNGMENNLAGVMNTYYAGEAYANWGYPGIVFSVVLVGLFVGFSHNLIVSHTKSIYTIMLYIVLLRFQASTFLGGFLDYLFSVSLLFSICVLIGIYLLTYEKRRFHANDAGEERECLTSLSTTRFKALSQG